MARTPEDPLIQDSLTHTIVHPTGADTQTPYLEDVGGGTRLAIPKTICAPDTSSLKPGSGATEGVLDLGLLGRPGYVTWAGLMGREDTR